MAIPSISAPMLSWSLQFVLPFPMEGLFSTQSIMVMLLVAYGAAMWMFLTSAPKVHTVMVSDLRQAQELYEHLLRFSTAEVPFQYYGYESGIPTIDAFYVTPELRSSPPSGEGFWYKLHKNTQIHIIPGAHRLENRNRHVCFNRECVEKILLRVQRVRLKHKVVSNKPLVFWVKDGEGQVIEIAEVKT